MNADGQLARAGRLLDALAEHGGSRRFGELAAVLDDLNPASLSRLLKAMQAAGMIAQVDAGYCIAERVAVWSAGLEDPRPLAVRLQGDLDRLSEQHGVTTILLEARGQRLAPVAKCMHQDAPALMPLGGSFAPRLPYFGSIFLLKPESTEAWVRRELTDAPGMIERSLAGGLRVVRHYLRHGVYRDAWLYPGQLRLAVPLLRDDRLSAVLGAAGLAATLTRDDEAHLFDALQTARRMFAG